MQSALKIRLLLRGMRSNEVVLGAVVVIVAVVLLVATAVVYLHPMGRKAISFETTDVASINVGEDVRVAGVPVGKITKLAIQPTAVRVVAEISEDTFIGTDSTVEVRMLTPVGGYAVTIIPVGNKPLGDAVIPVDHVTVPYSIADVLQAAPHVTDNVNGTTIEATIDQVAQGLQHNSASVGSIVAGLNSIATIMDQQRDQVEKTMALAAEYLKTFNGSREFVFQLLQKIDVVESTYDTNKVGFDYAYQMLGDVVVRLVPVEQFYRDHKEQLLAAINQARDAISNFEKSLDPVIGQLKGISGQLQSWLTPDGMRTLGGGTILATGICVPIPGRVC